MALRMAAKRRPDETGPMPCAEIPADKPWPGVIPPDKPYAPPAFLHHFLKNPLRCLPRSVYEEPLVPHEIGPVRIVWVTDPDLVEDVFLHRHDVFPKPPLEQRVFSEPLGQSILTSQGDDWRWQRHAVSGLFRHQNLLSYVPAMAQAAERLADRWQQSPNGQTHPIDQDLTGATYDAISHTLFGGEAAPEAAQIQAGVSGYLNNIVWEIVAGLTHWPSWAWHPGRGRLRRSSAKMRGAVNALLDRWERDGVPEGQHLLGALLKAQEPGQHNTISRERVLNNLLTFLNAGHETTAKALIWTLYVLSRAPEWQQRIRNEVSEVAGDRPLSGDDIEKLVVTRQVFEESMRLYAPAPVLTRLATQDGELGGLTLKKDTLVFVPIWAVHRHQALWDAPNDFIPERFAPEQRQNFRRTQFMPFGFGPRICIGASFSIIEGVSMLATLMRRVSVEWDGQHIPEPLSRVTLWPKGGMPLKVTWND